MPKYTLHYFNARGRAELIRLVFAASDNLKYTDRRFDAPEWPGIKPTTPLGSVPYLEVDNTVLPQSISIARYLAREANLAGRNNLEQAQADAVVDTVMDAFNYYMSNVFSVGEPKVEAAAKFFAEVLPKHLDNIEKLISIYGKHGHSVGDRLTWADLQIFNVLSPLIQKDPSLIAKHAHIQRVLKTVETHPKISAYLKQRPPAPF